jgi:hypothetical protein
MVIQIQAAGVVAAAGIILVLAPMVGQVLSLLDILWSYRHE